MKDALWSHPKDWLQRYSPQIDLRVLETPIFRRALLCSIRHGPESNTGDVFWPEAMDSPSELGNAGESGLDGTDKGRSFGNQVLEAARRRPLPTIPLPSASKRTSTLVFREKGEYTSLDYRQ